MTGIIKVKKTGDESNANLLRRFSRHIRGSQMIRLIKDRKYFSRHESELKKKRSALQKMAKRKEYERMRKLGEIKDVFHRKF